jgi:hypothetical protein
MTVRLKRALLTLASGLLYGTVVVPALGHADTGASSSSSNKGLNCPDGTVVDEENHQCVDLVAGISKQLQALPAPPSLGGGGGGSLGGLAGGIPSLGTVNLPDVVLPSVGLGLVPNLAVNLQPQLGGIPGPPAINPLNPLGLPPPPF